MCSHAWVLAYTLYEHEAILKPKAENNKWLSAQMKCGAAGDGMGI